jgi:hypothetical protein
LTVARPAIVTTISGADFSSESADAIERGADACRVADGTPESPLGTAWPRAAFVAVTWRRRIDDRSNTSRPIMAVTERKMIAR